MVVPMRGLVMVLLSAAEQAESAAIAIEPSNVAIAFFMIYPPA
jgi:hypothetical protein